MRQNPIEDTVTIEHHAWGYYIEGDQESVGIVSHNFRDVEWELIWMRRKKKGKKTPTEVPGHGKRKSRK